MSARNRNIGDAVPKLVKAARSGRTAEVNRCLNTIAVSLERDGDAVGAAAVRATYDQTQMLVGRPLEANTALLWHQPTDPMVAPVFDGELADAVERLVREIEAAPRLLAAGLDAPTRVFFTGPSGTGKTLTARWLGHRLGLPVAVAQIPGVVSSYMGATSAKLAELFGEAGRSPCILFLDEIDALCRARDRGDDSGAVREDARSTSTLLQLLDRVDPLQVVVVATNMPEVVDVALRRRLSLRVDFGQPSKSARERMVARWLATAPVSEAERARLVEQGEGASCADLRAAAMAAGRAAVLAQESVP